MVRTQQGSMKIVRSSITLLIVGVMLPALIWAPGIVRAQPGGDSPFLALLPGLRNAPAPNWLRPGMRITYYGASASIPGARYYYYQDPNGDWVDPQGNRYKQGDIPSASGHGFNQYTILGLDPTVAVLEARTYLITDVSGPALLTAISGSAGLPGAGGDVWLNALVLRQAIGMRAQGFQAAQVPYRLNGKQYDALWIRSGTPAASLTYVFDLNSGLQLHSASATAGAPIQGPQAPGGSNAGSTLLAQSTVVDVRTLNVPWASEPAPEWVRRYSVLRYEGSVTTSVSGASSITYGAAFTIRRQSVGTNWASYMGTYEQQYQSPSQVVRNSGSAQFTGLWIPPRWLGQLRQGQSLDSDPVTKVTVAVGRVGRTPQGQDVVWIVESNNVRRDEYGYDRASGMLLYYTSQQAGQYNQQVTQLHLAQRQ